MGRPSLRDVAELAGTSTAVVSYVVNHGPRPVAPDTRRRVEEAIAQLGYRPNRVAQSLRRSRTGTLGLVVPDLTKAFFAQVASAVETAALGAGQRLLISSTQFDDRREAAQIQALLDARVDAIGLVPARGYEMPAALLERAGVPWVLVHRHPDTGGGPSRSAVVGADRDAGRQATEHLLWHGHERIACLSGPEKGSPVYERTRGFIDALEAGARLVDRRLVVSCGYRHLTEAAYRAAARLMDRHPDVTAILATTDEHALGIYRAAAEKGRRIGDSIAVLSIDGTSHAAFLTPPLAVMAVPFEKFGQRVVSALLAAAASPSSAGEAVEPLALKLTPRASCGCS